MNTEIHAPKSSAAGRPKRGAFQVVWLAGFLGATLSLAIAVWFANEARRLDEARFLELGNVAGVHLERRVEDAERLLRSLQRLLNEHAFPDSLAWDEFMNQVAPQWNYPGVLAIGYATNTSTPDTLRRMAAWSRTEAPLSREEFYRVPAGAPPPTTWKVWQLDTFRDDLRPAAAFGAELAVTNSNSGAVQQRRFEGPAEPLEIADHTFYIKQLDGRSRLLAGEPDEAVLQNAIYRDDVKIRGSQPLINRANGKSVPGATLIVPTYHPRRHEFWKALTPDAGWPFEAYWLRWNLNAGLVFAYLDLAAMLQEVQGPGPHALRVEIHAAPSNTVSAASWLNPDGQPMRAADATFQPSFRYSHTWAMFGDRWTLFFHTTPLFDAQSTRSRAWWFLGCGLLCTALVCWALSVQVRGRWREATRAAELQEARDALQAAYRQRERLSHDLHDGAIQSLYAVQLGLSRAARELQELAPESGLRLSDSRASLDVVIGELRQFITQLENTGELHDATGLAAVLDAVVRRLRLASPVAIDLVCDDAISRRLTPTQAVQLASLAREALSNSLRHANARRVSLNLRAQGSACILEIQDDGRGFDLASPSGQGLGLRSIRQRATDLGGKLELESTPGVGTLVRIHVPLAAAPLAGPG